MKWIKAKQDFTQFKDFEAQIYEQYCLNQPDATWDKVRQGVSEIKAAKNINELATIIFRLMSEPIERTKRFYNEDKDKWMSDEDIKDIFKGLGV